MKSEGQKRQKKNKHERKLSKRKGSTDKTQKKKNREETWKKCQKSTTKKIGKILSKNLVWKSRKVDDGPCPILSTKPTDSTYNTH